MSAGSTCSRDGMIWPLVVIRSSAMMSKEEDGHPQTVSHGYVTSTEVDEKTRDEQWMYFAIVISLVNLSV